MKCEGKDCKEETEVDEYKIEDCIYHFCNNHASEFGFCPGCHCFMAGTEEFDFPIAHGNIPGYCGDCSTELKQMCEDYDDEDEEQDDFGFDYPVSNN